MTLSGLCPYCGARVPDSASSNGTGMSSEYVKNTGSWVLVM